MIVEEDGKQEADDREGVWLEGWVVKEENWLGKDIGREGV